MKEGKWHGAVVWFNPGLNLAVLEGAGGFVIGSVECGTLRMHQVLCGELAHPGLARLCTDSGEEVTFLVEADALSEDQINDLLGFVVG